MQRIRGFSGVDGLHKFTFYLLTCLLTYLLTNNEQTCGAPNLLTYLPTCFVTLNVSLVFNNVISIKCSR